MVGPIIVPTSCGFGFNHTKLPPEKRPAYVYYRRYDPKTGTMYTFKWYVEELGKAEKEMNRNGHLYWIYGFEQDYGFEPIKVP